MVSVSLHGINSNMFFGHNIYTTSIPKAHMQIEVKKPTTYI